MTRHVEFLSNTKLTNLECKCLVDEGPKLFALLKLTPEAKEFLKWNEKLAGVIAKW